MIADAVRAADRCLPPRSRRSGIASAGPIHLHSGTVSPINIRSWRGFPLRDRVAAAVPGVPVRLGGDGVCMALGEHWLGAGRSAAGMRASCWAWWSPPAWAAGWCSTASPTSGRTGNAGHVGHVVVEQDGRPCACGGRGCVETIASGPSMVRWARENGWSAPPGAGARELAAAAAAGDPVAVRAFGGERPRWRR